MGFHASHRAARSQIQSSSEQDRVKCIFPSSVGSKQCTTSGKWAAAELQLSTSQIVEPAAALDLLGAVGTAWTLVLQCFVVADVFTFTWLQDAQASCQPGIESCCVVHLDQDDAVLDLSRAFSSPSLSSASKVAYSKQTERHQSNTSVTVRPAPTPNSRKDSGTGLPPLVDLNLTVFEADGLPSSLKMDYNTHHTSHEISCCLLEVFQHILYQVLRASRTMRLKDIDRCSPQHRSAIKAATMGETRIVDRCIHDMIVEQCERTPDRLAVVAPGQRLTYRQLNHHSAKLAYHLQAMGVKPETFVLCCFNKSASAIIARLAILRAGGAYISVHADNPPSYLDSVITQTKASILLTDKAYASKFKNFLPQMVILSRDLFTQLPLPPNTTICADATPESACLVLFTSGSTGKPKGIVHIHRTYATSITSYAKDLGLSKDTRYLQFDDYAFDISNIEFLAPLMLGGCCVVPGRMTCIDDLVSEINSTETNIIFLTPTVAIKLDPSDVPGLRDLCVGGEPLPQNLILKWRGSKTRLLCQYGMGETAVCCALNTKLGPSVESVIGRPPTGSIWITDPLSINKLMPPGACGEIIIEGPHLARGYLDPKLAQRSDAGFLKKTPAWLLELHPQRAQTTRLYRSGDLGRLNFDGTISYLGRQNTILKLDGCRIDAMEIEHLSRKHLSPEDTIIVDLLGEPGGRIDPCLTAIMHIAGGSTPKETYPGAQDQDLTFVDANMDSCSASKAALVKQAIAQSLPPYMVPMLFLTMNHVPRTRSKKIDRKKIREFAQSWFTEALEASRSMAARDSPRIMLEEMGANVGLFGMSVAVERSSVA